MDRNLIVSEMEPMKKETRKRKLSVQKNQPLKVVYISNPMRVHTSASEFRALVQELTGRDAEFPDPAKFHQASIDVGEMNLEKNREGDDDEEASLDVATTMEDSNDDFLESPYESFEEMLMREMLMENFAVPSRSVESSGLVIGALM
ncbi:sigma factor binding protein 2, chloroplastic-like [Momordica charantia]|uniref:Sigma factor binding protein 2, chloroplastic-like n=1 Tax=Momordica charantia TaxID=3673 RepID=A0A6J1D137_MOMCH|nr:sigma factor binding protein 2, chloroplastic-like [Momordica charantia]